MSGTTFTPAVRRLFASYFAADQVAHLRVVAHEHDHQYVTRGGGVTYGWMAYTVATGLGLPEPLARGAGELLDALEPAIDLADNLADTDLDRRLGRDPDARYPGVPREALPALPALIVGACVAGLHERFPAPKWRPAHAARRLLGVLGCMTHAQGLPLDHAERNDALSGEAGLLWCLPLWLLPESHPAAGLAPALEHWARQFGSTIQLSMDVLENPSEPARRERLDAARASARAIWPTTAPFRPQDALAADRLLAGPA
ncbi:MAG: hypothetical protein Q8P18_08585 [Pseudomonadota bacterium]|nr:hypothetical protein [Pseudomonadota bacterium]